jgi:hypothetical protein
MRSACAPSVCNSADGPLLPWVALAIGLAAIGHFFWEAAQLPLYTLWRTGTPREVAFAVIHCTGGDVLITTAAFAAAVALAWRFRWPAFGWRMVFTAIVLGAGYTIFSEWLNVEIRHSWSYEAAMPVLPFIGTGLTPLLQWLIVPGLALAVIGHRYRHARRLAR